MTDQTYYHALFSAAGDAMVVCDEAGRAVDCNPAACTLLACTREQLLGTTPVDWSPTVQPDGSDSAQRAAEVFARVQAGELASFEWVNRRLDGSLVHVEVSVRRVVQGTNTLSIVISRNITERAQAQRLLKESEERFRTLFEQAPLAYQSLDMGANILTVNNAWLRLMGENRREDVVGKSITEYLDEESLPTLAENFPQFVRSGSVRGPVFDVRARNGVMRRVTVTGRIGYDAEGNALRTHCILNDITERWQIEAEREEALAFMHAAFDQSPSSILVADVLESCDASGTPEVRIRMANQEAVRLRGASPGGLVGVSLSQALGKWPVLFRDGSPCPESELPLFRAALKGETIRGEEYILRDAEGRDHWVLVNAAPILRDGRISSGIAVVHDITAQKQAQAELNLYARIFANSGEAIVITDQNNCIVAINPAFTRLTGFEIDELRGQNPRVLASGRTPGDTYRSLWAHLKESDFWLGELWDRHKDGSEHPKSAAISAIRDENGVITHYMASCVDITERKAAQARVEYLARHDVLTGLSNRHDLESRMEQALRFALRDGSKLAVMFIDLDRFKTVNDSLGHQVGDGLLTQVAPRLLGAVRDSDIVARLGGDEFVVVLTDMSAALDAAAIAGSILQGLAEPYQVHGHTLGISASVGVSVFPQDGTDTTSLMKAADTAMYHAKAQGRNNVQFFTASMNAEVQERLMLERDLRVALRESQLSVHYQPKVLGSDASVRGVEALVRWRHPRLGMVPPLKFIAIAEESGFIDELGQWVLNEACRQLAAWHALGWRHLNMAVNLSAHQLRAPDLVTMVSDTLARHGLAGTDLELEVTESVAMADPERAIGRLQQLRALGVALAIDDFGTGYSSLAYLKLLPIQTLKLDRAFVRDIETDENDAAISAATLALAHSLGLSVVAEGVETPGQRTFLSQHRCDVLQGYLFGRPEPAETWTAQWENQHQRDA